MSTQSADQKLFVDDVVTALTGSVLGDPRAALQDQMRRATQEFDLRTAEAFARALLEALCQAPIDPRRLEALLILGLAHPTILEKHRISLIKEGERLASMLERTGQAERARCLLEVIAQAAAAPHAAPDPDAEPDAAGTHREERPNERIETLLRQADEAASRGRTHEAIRRLQEVVALDRNRRDVARMIRDLRWQEKERRARAVRRLKTAAAAVLLSAAAAGFVWRESDVRARYRAIPEAGTTDVSALRARRDAIDALVTQERAWLGLPEALRERSRLERDIAAVAAQAVDAARQTALVREQNAQEAEDARASGMVLAQQGRFEEALSGLRRALELSDTKWERRREVEANVSAIAAWIEQGHAREGAPR